MQLRDDEARFTALAEVVLIGLGWPEAAREFCVSRRLVPAFHCVVAPDKRAHHAFGLRQGTALQVAGPQQGLRFLRNQLNPELRQGGLDEDPLQMSGTFIVDASGIVRFAHRNRDSSDNPPNRELLEALERLSTKPGRTR